MDLIALAAAKNYANKVTAGFKSVELDGMNLIFTLLDDTKATVAIPAPADGKDGISVQDLSIDADGSLLCHMSDGSVIDAGKVPMTEVELTDYYTKEEINEIIENSGSSSYYILDGGGSSSVVYASDITLADNEETIRNIFDEVENNIIPTVFFKTKRYPGGLSSAPNVAYPTIVSISLNNDTTCFVDLYFTLFNTNSTYGNMRTGVAGYVRLKKDKTKDKVSVETYKFTNIYAPVNYNEFLSRTNTSSYTPTENYHPATKKYVDDAIAAAITSALEGEY